MRNMCRFSFQLPNILSLFLHFCKSLQTSIKKNSQILKL